MPNIIEITDIAAPQLDPYVRLTEAQLKNRLHPEDGLFIAESPKVIGYALDAGYAPISLLMERRHIAGKAASLLEGIGDWTEMELHDRVMEAIPGLGMKNGQFLWPLRIAISGQASTPGGAFEIAYLLGKDETLRRLKASLEKL